MAARDGHSTPAWPQSLLARTSHLFLLSRNLVVQFPTELSCRFERISDQ